MLEPHEEIRSIVARGGKELIFNTNIHGMNLAAQYPWLKNLRNTARLVHCDGFGVILAARLLGIHIPERITYADWLPRLAAFCAAHHSSMYFLGAEPGVAEKAAERLRSLEPDLRIVGIHHGYFEKEGPETDRVVREINAPHPDILIVGFGMPLQERWLRDNWHRIDANVFLAGGGCFDVLSGRVPRAPRWLVDRGLEWAFLSLVRPRRFVARYLGGNLTFMIRVFREKHGRPDHDCPGPRA